MKISSKIILLTGILLGSLAGNSLISWFQIHKISLEFNNVVKGDLALMQSSTALNELQLKREVLFSKLTSSAEELSFGNINESRRAYLIDFIKDLKENFKEEGLQEDQRIKQAISLSKDSTIIQLRLINVQKTLLLYDQKVNEIFVQVLGEGYQLRMEDLDQIEDHQGLLRKDLQFALGEIWQKADSALERINILNHRSQHALLISLLFSFAFALLVASAIIRRIHVSLKALVNGVRALHQGQLGKQVQVSSNDEIGELAKAFNQTSTQLREYETKILDKNKELEMINRDLDRFVKLISHDINGPLSGVIGYSAYLQQHKQGFDPKTQQIIAHLNQSSVRLNGMVKDLLEMTKITRQFRPFEKVDVGGIISEVVQRQEFLIQKTAAMIQIPKSLPEVWADKLKLSVVFFNLIGNAIKYSVKEGSKPQISIEWQKADTEHIFCIKDNGIGIDPKHFQDIFNMFQRLPDAEVYEGSGVGLAIVKEIVQEHGGRIWVESANKDGSRFFFTIPLESRKHLS